jgi:putative hydrolase of the HAD superfamily
VSSDLGLRKPDPEAFSVVAQRTGFQVSELLFFDDTPENVDGARTAGIQAVLVESSADVRQALLRFGIEAAAPGEVCP